jgi:hypothetical protein
MDEDDFDAACAHQQELEARRLDEEQALLRADPAFVMWLDQLELKQEKEQDHAH